MSAPDDTDDPVIADLLRELRDLRLRVSTDLTAASGAVDDDDVHVARDILDADRAELAEFHRRASHRLAVAEGAPAHPMERPSPGARAARLRRLLPLLPAGAVLAASSAAAALVIGTAPSGQAPAGAAPATTTAGNTATGSADGVPAVAQQFRRLQQVIARHRSAPAVIAAAAAMHRDVALLVSASAGDPGQLQLIVAWLQREQRLVAEAQPAGAAAVLAASRRLVERALSAVPPVSVPSTVPISPPGATTTPTPTPTSDARHTPSSHPARTPWRPPSTHPSPTGSSAQPTRSTSGGSTPPPIAPTQPLGVFSP